MTTRIQVPEGLLNQTEEFHKQILTVLPGIHCAIGYGLANCILIEGTDGNILIDTLESRESALEVKKDFQLISSKPIKAIIYTHHHADHIGGAQVFAEDNTPIYSHSKTIEILQNRMNLIQPITFERAARQFGTFLTKETGHINCGIGQYLNYNAKNSQAFLLPTKTFDNDCYQLNICGRELSLYYAPGETDDQIVIYMAKENVLFPADNIYKSFPNIYAIRGTPTRDTKQWISSLDLMRNFHAEYLIPSHTRPIKGREYIYDLISKYRDTIQFVHDQTVRFINQGLTSDQIIEQQLIQLPKQLRRHPYLQEFYGTLHWSIRAIFDHYLGWFSGKTSDLNPDPPKIRAENLIKLGGNAKKVFESAQQAYKEEKYQWALELIEALTIYHEDLNLFEVNQLHCSILEKLASFQTSANGRNWYLTKSLEVQGLININPSEKQRTETIFRSSIHETFMLLSVNLDWKKAEELSLLLLFHFNDTLNKLTIEIRNSIMDIKDQRSEEISPEHIHAIIEFQTELIWKQILIRSINLMDALENNQIIIKDGYGMIHPERMNYLIEFFLLFI